MAELPKGEGMKVYKTEVGRDWNNAVFRDIATQVVRFRVRSFFDCCLRFLGPVFSSIEVFIGAWNNEYSAIRFNGAGELVKKHTPKILSAAEFREFWIVWYGNDMEVGRGGDFEPFLKTHISLAKPITITKYAFATGNATGQFMFLDEREFITNSDLTHPYEPIYGKRFTFNLSCEHDSGTAYIELKMKRGETDKKYRVILGRDNTHSEIRENDTTVVQRETPNECTTQVKHYWINLRAGHIQVGRVGEDNAFLDHKIQDPDYMVRYIGIATKEGTEGKWNLHL